MDKSKHEVHIRKDRWIDLEVPRSNRIDHLWLIDDWVGSVDINMDVSSNDVMLFVCGAGTRPFGIEQNVK
jgi:hypothetical protein